MEYRKKLNPECSLRAIRGMKGTRQKVIITHNPSEIDKNQKPMVNFPKLDSNVVIIPGTANLSFNVKLSSTADRKWTLVSNVGRANVKKLGVKFEGNEILNVDDFDVFVCYIDLWKTDRVRETELSETRHNL